jgi:Domain of unknown function (DUF4157)
MMKTIQPLTSKPDSVTPQKFAVQRSAASSSPVHEMPNTVHDVLQSPGQPLEPNTREFMESRFNQDFSGVRVHTNPRAAQSAREVNALAYTVGRNVVFGDGSYAPNTRQGQSLIAHELVHTVQQGNVSNPGLHRFSMTSSNDPLEHQASVIADRVMQGETIAPNAISSVGPSLARLPTPAPAAPTPAAPAAPTTQADAPSSVASTEVVSLATGTFNPSAELAAEITSEPRQDTKVAVALGNLARGWIRVHKDQDGTFSALNNQNQGISLSVPALEPLRQARVEPMLVIQIGKDSQIKGHVGIRTEKGFTSANGFSEVIARNSQALGWTGFDLGSLPSPVNSLENGSLNFGLDEIPFNIGGFVQGKANFGFTAETTTFSAEAKINIKYLENGELTFARDANGQLSMRGNIQVDFGSMQGQLVPEYGNGVVNVQGTVTYSSEKFKGSVTLLVTDAQTASNIARSQLAPEAMLPSAQPAANAPAEGEAPQGPRPGPRALAGYGDLQFAFTDWLQGTAKVVIDNQGNLTVVGKIAPPQEIELFPQKDFIKPLFRTEVRTLYGVPLVGNVFLFANVGLEALAKLGPGKLYNIQLNGTYTTDPDVLQNLSLQATLNVSAFAGLRMRAEGGAGVELLGHDIKAGVGINGLAGVRGYVEAVPTIGFREVADPQAGKKGEFFLHGHMELAAQPFLGLSGDLFVELDSPWWSPAPDKKWNWPLGNLEYPLPGEFGIGADVDYVLGSGQVPEVQFGAASFDSGKFMTDMLNDHVPPKRGGDQETPGKWDEEQQGAGEAAGALPAPVTNGEAAHGQHDQMDGDAPAPQNEQRWLDGLNELRILATTSLQDPFDQSEIVPVLSRIKSRYGFSVLSAIPSGDVWDVTAEMNPKIKFESIKASSSFARERPSNFSREEIEAEMAGHVQESVHPDEDRLDDHPTVPHERPPGDLFNRTQIEIDEINENRERGNTFNTVSERLHDHNEVELENGKRLDSYDPGVAIISRKSPAGNVLDTERTINYVLEILEKYPRGTRIADTPKNRQAGLAGKTLQGKYVLKVPALRHDVPQEAIDFAARAGVEISDYTGKVYR